MWTFRKVHDVLELTNSFQKVSNGHHQVVNVGSGAMATLDTGHPKSQYSGPIVNDSMTQVKDIQGRAHTSKSDHGHVHDTFGHVF